MSIGQQNLNYGAANSVKSSSLFSGDHTASRTSNAAAPSWEFEMGYVERPVGQ